MLTERTWTLCSGFYVQGHECYLFLNDTALAIWDLCDGETWPKEMVRAICEVSGLHEDVVIEDIARTLNEFEEAGLLVWMIDQ